MAQQETTDTTTEPQGEGGGTVISKSEVEAAQRQADEAALAAQEERRKELEAKGKAADDAAKEATAALDVLEPNLEPVRWVVGRPPDNGGNKDQYSIYFQKTLGYMPRMRFFALLANTIANAMKQGNQIRFSAADVGSGSLQDRMSALTEDDFGDASSFLTLAFQLIGTSPEFLVDCYVLWMGVPRNEQRWAKIVLAQEWDPDNDQWGLKDEDHELIVQTFLDQNYDQIRDFFTRTVPALFERGRKLEARHSPEEPDRESEQDQ